MTLLAEWLTGTGDSAGSPSTGTKGERTMKIKITFIIVMGIILVAALLTSGGSYNVANDKQN